MQLILENKSCDMCVAADAQGGISYADKVAIAIPLVIIGSTVLAALVAVCIVHCVRRRNERRQKGAKDKKQPTAYVTIKSLIWRVCSDLVRVYLVELGLS